MKKWIFLVALAACQSPEASEKMKSEKTDEQVAVSVTEIVSEEQYFGEKIDKNGALQPEEMVAQLMGTDTLVVKLRAQINETCSKKGCWMKVDLGKEDEMMVRFKDYGFFVPTEGVEDKWTIFEGKAYRDTVSVETLQHYAEDAGKSDEMIAAITEPEVTIAFEATGVIIYPDSANN